MLFICCSQVIENRICIGIDSGEGIERNFQWSFTVYFDHYNTTVFSFEFDFTRILIDEKLKNTSVNCFKIENKKNGQK